VHIYGIVVDPAMLDGYVNFEGRGSTRSVSIYPNANQIIFGDQGSPLGGPSIGAVGLLSDGVSFGLEASSGNDLVLKVDDNANYTFDLIDSGTGNRALSYTEGQLHIRNRRQGEGYFEDGDHLTTFRISPYLSSNVVTGGGGLGSGPRIRLETLDMRGTPLASSGEEFTVAGIVGYTKENKPRGPARNWVDLSGVVLGDALVVIGPTTTTTFTAVDTLVNPTDFLIGGTDAETAVNLSSAIPSVFSGVLTATPTNVRIVITHDVVGAFGNTWMLTTAGSGSFTFPTGTQFWGGSNGLEGYLGFGVAGVTSDGIEINGVYSFSIRVEPNGALGFIQTVYPPSSNWVLEPANVLLELDPDGSGGQLLLRTPEGNTPGLRFVPSARGEVNGTIDGKTLGILSYGSLQNGGQGQISGVVKIAGRLVSNDNHVGELVLEVDSGWGGGTRFIIDGYSTLWFDNERTASIGAETSKLKFGLGEYEPALELLQSTHVYTGNRYTWIGSRSPITAGVTPTYGLVFLTNPPDTLIYRSTDGITWTNAGLCPFAAQSYGMVAIGNSLFTTTGNQTNTFIQRSLDGGTTWAVITDMPIATWPSVDSIFSLANGLLVIGCANLASESVLRYSADEGTTWTDIPGPAFGLYEAALEQSGSRWVAAKIAMGGGGVLTVVYSDDEGVTWTPSTLPIETLWGTHAIYPAIRQAGADLLLIVTIQTSYPIVRTETYVLRSTDSGSSWVLESTLVDVRIANDSTPLITSDGYLCFAAQVGLAGVGYVARSVDIVSNPITLEVVPIRVDPLNTTGPVDEIHQTLEFNGRIYGIGHGPTPRLSAVVWSDDLTGANWLNLSDPITKLAPQGGYLDLGAQYLELTEPLTGDKYFSVEGDSSTGTVLSTSGGPLSLYSATGPSVVLGTDNQIDLRQLQLRMYFDIGQQEILPSLTFKESTLAFSEPNFAFLAPPSVPLRDGAVLVNGSTLVCVRDAYSSTDTAQVVRSLDNGNTWSDPVTIPDTTMQGYYTSSVVASGLIFQMVRLQSSLNLASQRLLVSPDNGMTWERRIFVLDGVPTSEPGLSMAIYASEDGNRLYLKSDANVVYVSSDLGFTWVSDPTAVFVSSDFYGVIDLGVTRFLIGSNELLVSIDSGATWENRALPSDGNGGYVGLYNGGLYHLGDDATGTATLYRSVDNGGTWGTSCVLNGVEYSSWNYNGSAVITPSGLLITTVRLSTIPTPLGCVLVCDLTLVPPSYKVTDIGSSLSNYVETHAATITSTGRVILSGHIKFNDATYTNAGILFYSDDSGTTWFKSQEYPEISGRGGHLALKADTLILRSSAAYSSPPIPDENILVISDRQTELLLDSPNRPLALSGEGYSLQIRRGVETHQHDRLINLSFDFRADQGAVLSNGYAFGFDAYGTFLRAEVGSITDPEGWVSGAYVPTPGHRATSLACVIGGAGTIGCFLSLNSNNELSLSKSSDNGVSWVNISVPDTFMFLSSFKLRPVCTGDGSIWFIGSSSSTPSNTNLLLISSLDSGDTWSTVAGPYSGACRVVGLMRDGGNIYLVLAVTGETSLQVSVSADDGNSWTDFEVPGATVESFTPIHTWIEAGSLYVVWENGVGGVSFTKAPLSDLVNSWTPPSEIATGVWIRSSTYPLAVNGDRWLLVSKEGQQNYILKGFDTGVGSLILLSSEAYRPDIHALLEVSSTSYLAFGHADDPTLGLLVYSTDSGATWTTAANNTLVRPEGEHLDIEAVRLNIGRRGGGDISWVKSVSLSFPSGEMILDGKLTATGDLELSTVASGAILKSPNGTRYKIAVDNDGVLTSTPV
jgi:hypothetical protein